MMTDQKALKLAEELWDKWCLEGEITQEQQAIVLLWKRACAYKWATKHPMQALMIHLKGAIR